MKENQERKAKMVDGFAQPQDVPVPNFAGYPEKKLARLVELFLL